MCVLYIPKYLHLSEPQQQEHLALCLYRALPEAPSPGLSLSDLPLSAAASAAAVEFVALGGVSHDNDDVDDDVGFVFYVHSAITTPVLDGGWDVNVLTQRYVS